MYFAISLSSQSNNFYQLLRILKGLSVEILEEYEERLDDVLNLNVQESIEKERHLIQMVNAMMKKKPDTEVSF